MRFPRQPSGDVYTDVSHEPSSRPILLSAMPAVTFPATLRHHRRKTSIAYKLTATTMSCMSHYLVRTASLIPIKRLFSVIHGHGHVDSHTHTHTHTHTFNGPLSGTTQVSRYQKGKTNLDFTEARDSEWQWHQLGHMQSAPRSRQINNHASTPSLKIFTGQMPFLSPNQQRQSTEGSSRPVA